MKQGPLTAAVARTPGGAAHLLNLDADGNTKVAIVSNTSVPASETQLNVNADALIFEGPGELVGFTVVTAGAAGGFNDAAAIGDAAAANKIATSPAVVGYYPCPFPVTDGLVYKVGAGQVVAVVYRPAPAA